jgi:hypothetical protein
MWQRVVVLGAVLVLCAGLLLGAALGLGLVPAPASADDGSGVLCTLADPRITESSGLAASRRHPGVLYTHNDSGDTPRVYAIGEAGKTIATLTLRGAKARDWEAIAAGRDDAGQPALFVGDIGDNLHGAWPSVSVYRVTEPATLRDATVRATRFRFRYADGARDAEALLVDPRTNRIYIASKEGRGAGLYQAPAKPRTDRVNVLRRIAGVPSLVTDGSFSPDGSRLVLRDYLTAHTFSVPGKGPVHELGTFGLPLQIQGESATYSLDGRYVLVGSEGPQSEVDRVALPEEARTAATSPDSGTGRPSGPAATSDGHPAADEKHRSGTLRNLAALLVAAGASALMIAAVRRGRR